MRSVTILLLASISIACSTSHGADGGPFDGGGPYDGGGRDTRCDEGLLICAAVQPTCDSGSIAAIQGGCWACVNPATCRPWGEPGCETDMTCDPTERCNPCGTSSCPECLDCVPACTPHGCPTETVLTCRCARPDCMGGVSIIRDGCWQCVTPDSCSDIGGGTRC
ncbi:MAG: hypothetical protein IT378_24405 [Sandaracinaceae bacterium]|nr:hypothetical protein [Sandaracinaceae bacterium]